MQPPAILLPPRATTRLMAEIEQALYSDIILRPGIDAIFDVKGARLPGWLEFLLYDYGLVDLTQYVPNPYVLLDEGRIWQIERGTFAAVYRALGWLGNGGRIDEARKFRRWWNSFQIYLDNLPAADVPGLDRIDRVVNLSIPLRSDFRRAVWGYDVPAAEFAYTRFGQSRYADESGVRLRAKGPKWSFGRRQEIAYTLTKDDGIALGNWLDPVSFGGGITWTNSGVKWQDAHFPWVSDSATQRAGILAQLFVGRTVYVCLRDLAGDVIGYRRARIARRVSQAAGGTYRFGSVSYEPDTSGTSVIVEAMTDFGEGAGKVAASASMVFDAAPVAPIPPGRLWLGPGELAGGVEVASSPVFIPLRQTVRERITYMVRF